METTINQQRKIWQQMPNFVNEWKGDNSVSKSFKRLGVQITKCKNSPFIVDWQLSDNSQNAVQLNLLF